MKTSKKVSLLLYISNSISNDQFDQNYKMLEGQKSLQKRINLEFGLLLLILLSTTARKEMTDLSKKSLFIIFVKENCISTLGQKSINHPKKMQFGNVNFHRIHIVKISLFFKTKFAFFKVS